MGRPAPINYRADYRQRLHRQLMKVSIIIMIITITVMHKKLLEERRALPRSLCNITVIR